MTEIKGWHVLGAFVLAFGIIISVNLTLAFNAVKTFPGLETKNSYVASQAFERNRQAQTRLDWEVGAVVEGGVLTLSVMKDGQAVEPLIERATFGRATHVGADQTPDFAFNGHAFTAPVTAGPGNWNLRLVARAEDGTRFEQRIIVKVVE
ncbi:MAG: FixH family protein [Paracoccaceae bacterium]|nr:FixH family protein [Paracoccaceae bacterium]